jgi:hypothetical protein
VCGHPGRHPARIQDQQVGLAGRHHQGVEILPGLDRPGRVHADLDEQIGVHEQQVLSATRDLGEAVGPALPAAPRQLDRHEPVGLNGVPRHQVVERQERLLVGEVGDAVRAQHHDVRGRAAGERRHQPLADRLPILHGVLDRDAGTKRSEIRQERFYQRRARAVPGVLEPDGTGDVALGPVRLAEDARG